jgi:two-component system NtrC family sensor kinase
MVTCCATWPPCKPKPPCLSCHAHQGYRVGDIRGGISVTQRYSADRCTHRAQHSSSRVDVWRGLFAGLLAGWLLLELLRRRWLELAGKIDELTATRGELVQSEKMASLGRMVAGFAHEINTPVGVAVGAVSQQEETLNRH